MIQIRERPLHMVSGTYFGSPELGREQEVEERMADLVGLKVFRLTMPNNWSQFKPGQLNDLIVELTDQVQHWKGGATTKNQKDTNASELLAGVNEEEPAIDISNPGSASELRAKFNKDGDAAIAPTPRPDLHIMPKLISGKSFDPQNRSDSIAIGIKERSYSDPTADWNEGQSPGAAASRAASLIVDLFQQGQSPGAAADRAAAQMGSLKLPPSTGKLLTPRNSVPPEEFSEETKELRRRVDELLAANSVLESRVFDLEKDGRRLRSITQRQAQQIAEFECADASGVDGIDAAERQPEA